MRGQYFIYLGDRFFFLRQHVQRLNWCFVFVIPSEEADIDFGIRKRRSAIFVKSIGFEKIIQTIMLGFKRICIFLFESISDFFGGGCFHKKIKYKTLNNFFFLFLLKLSKKKNTIDAHEIKTANNFFN